MLWAPGQPQPLTWRTWNTVEVREEKRNSSGVGTEGWDRLFSLHPTALAAAHAAGEGCPWLSGSATQPCPAGAETRQLCSSCLQPLPDVSTPCRAAGLAWDARVVRGPNTTPAPPSLLCSLQLLRAAAALPFSHPSGHISALAGSLAGFVVPLCQLCSHQRLPGHLETPSSTQYCYCAKWELYSFLVVGVFFCYFFLNQLRRQL